MHNRVIAQRLKGIFDPVFYLKRVRFLKRQSLFYTTILLDLEMIIFKWEINKMKWKDQI